MSSNTGAFEAQLAATEATIAMLEELKESFSDSINVLYSHQNISTIGRPNPQRIEAWKRTINDNIRSITIDIGNLKKDLPKLKSMIDAEKRRNESTAEKFARGAGRLAGKGFSALGSRLSALETDPEKYKGSLWYSMRGKYIGDRDYVMTLSAMYSGWRPSTQYGKPTWEELRDPRIRDQYPPENWRRR